MEGYRKIVDGFNESNEYGVKVEIQNITNADYKTKLTTMMASDSEPDIIFTWPLGYLENFVNGDKVVSIQKYLDEDEDWKNSFNGGILDPLTYDGEVYAIPTQQSTAIMYYNKAIFDKYGLEVPTTYDEYVQICDTLKENGVTPVALASTADDAWLVSQYIQQLSDGIKGEDLFNSLKDGTGKWNDEGMVEAGKLFQEEVNKGYFEDGFTGVSREEAQLQFANGQTAMYFNGCWEISNLDKKENAAEAENISCFLMPAVNEEYAGVEVGSVDTSYAITKNCKNVDAAVALLKYMTNEESTSLLLYDYGRTPSTNFDIDNSKLTPLCADFINLLGDVKVQTPWFDRVDTDLGNEFNNTTKGGVFRYFGNSVIIAVSVVLVTVILATMASYAIARMHWKLANLTHSIFLLGMMIPIYALVIPLFSIFKGMGLLDTHLAVIIPQIAVGFPLAIFIICGFMRSIPTELEEAAIIDGCTVFQCFFKIILPIAKSSVVTVAVVQFINVWNDLLLPRIFLTDSSKMTLPVGLTNFQAMYSTDYVGMIAAVIITIIPSIVVYILLHKQIMEGMVAGAVKG